MGLMDITVAYFHPFFHPETVKRDFERIRATGATNIVYAIHEQEEQRWARDLERGLQIARDLGLRVFLSLGRYGNLFAGPAHTPSWFTFRNMESRVKDRHGRYHGETCYNHEPFRSFIFKEIEYFLKNYPIDGILIDEPRGPDITCFCSVCRALCPDIADLPHFRRRSMIEFFGEMFATVKQAKPGAKTAVVLLPEDLDLAEELASSIPQLDIIGCHLFWQLLNEDVTKVAEWGQTLVSIAHQYEKQSQLWLQNYNLSAGDEEQLEPSFKMLLGADPDEVACYYYWRNNENPERVWELTLDLLRRVPRPHFFKHPTLSRLPAISASPSKEKQQHWKSFLS